VQNNFSKSDRLLGAYDHGGGQQEEETPATAGNYFWPGSK
jgi:hypothetical protein